MVTIYVEHTGCCGSNVVHAPKFGRTRAIINLSGIIGNQTQSASQTHHQSILQITSIYNSYDLNICIFCCCSNF